MSPKTLRGLFLLEANKRRIEEYMLTLELFFGYFGKLLEVSLLTPQMNGSTLKMNDVINRDKTFKIRDLIIMSKEGTLYEDKYSKIVEKIKEDAGLSPLKISKNINKNKKSNFFLDNTKKKR